MPAFPTEAPLSALFSAELSAREESARRALSDTSDDSDDSGVDTPARSLAAAPHTRTVGTGGLDPNDVPLQTSASTQSVSSIASSNVRESTSVYGSMKDEYSSPRPAPRTQAPEVFITRGDPTFDTTHLPNIAAGSKDPTALANWDVEQELEFTIGKVMGENVFANLLKDKDAQRRFRDYLESLPESNPLLLDLYNDIVTFSSLSIKLRAASQSIEDIYLLKDSPNRLALPISVRGPLLNALHNARSVGASIAEPQKELLGSLFNVEFQAFMQKKLVDSALKRLGTWSVAAGTGDGLADCFCLTNPRLRDHPIVLASEGFSTLTQYPLDMIVGRNCRFLQGPGTSPDSVLRLRNAINSGVSITSLLLNYRRDGTPFFNLLCMLPLKDSQGSIKYYLGGQIDVTADMPVILGTAEDGSSTPRQAAVRSKHRFTSAVQHRSDSLLADPLAPLPGDNSLRRTDSRSTIGSASRVSGTLRQNGTGGISSSAVGSGFGGRTMPRRSSKGTELGLTREEHAAGLNNASPAFNTKLTDFEETYSRVILIHKEQGTVLFATPGLASFCGVTKSTMDSLTGMDFCKLIAGPTKDVSHRLRGNIRTAISAGHSYSLAVGLQLKKEAAKDIILRRKDRSEIKKCFLHLTPIATKDGVVEAFVAVFGALQ